MRHSEMRNIADRNHLGISPSGQRDKAVIDTHAGNGKAGQKPDDHHRRQAPNRTQDHGRLALRGIADQHGNAQCGKP